LFWFSFISVFCLAFSTEINRWHTGIHRPRGPL
jgi:hypothetical protein